MSAWLKLDDKQYDLSDNIQIDTILETINNSLNEGNYIWLTSELKGKHALIFDPYSFKTIEIHQD